jgi:hypothetical protein
VASIIAKATNIVEIIDDLRDNRRFGTLRLSLLRKPIYFSDALRGCLLIGRFGRQNRTCLRRHRENLELRRYRSRYRKAEESLERAQRQEHRRPPYPRYADLQNPSFYSLT